MSIIKLNVTEHLLTLGSNTLITESSYDVDGVNVEFDSSWKGFAPIVVFSRKNELSYTVLDEAGFGKIPNEILAINSNINICVLGIGTSEQMTTNIIKFRIKESMNLELEEPDLDTYKQILSQYGRVLESQREIYKEIEDTNNLIADTKAEVDTAIEEKSTELQNNISAENTERILNDDALKKRMDYLSSRMDSFMRLEEGTTTADAELIDIRLDSNGKTHTSAGAAVRAQTLQLSNNAKDDAYNLYSMYEYSDNKMHWSENDVIQDAYLDKNGEIISYEGWWISDYLAVEPDKEYVYIKNWAEQSLADGIYYCLYDVCKNYISGVDGASSINTDIRTAYIRVSLRSSYFNGGCTIIEKSLYEAGLTNYIPYEKRFKENKILEQSIINIESNISDIEDDILEIEERADKVQSYAQPKYDKVMRSINRIGEVGGVPHHSIPAYIKAFKMGFRILLCDLRFTSDNVPVLLHDTYLNQYRDDVYDSEGNPVSTENPIYIAQNTYETLNAYDYGKYISEEYAGCPLMTLTDMLSLVKKLGVELYIEVKAMTEEQAKIACDLVKKFGLSNVTSWAGEVEQMSYVINNIDTARVSTMPREITDEVITELEGLKTGKNKVFVFGWNTTTLTEEIVQELIEKDIEFEFGTLDSEEEIILYFEKGQPYQYCTGVESNKIVAGKVILENTLK